jgi:Ca2+-transporting ATPase
MITGDHPRTARASRPTWASSKPGAGADRAPSSTRWTMPPLLAAVRDLGVSPAWRPAHKLRIVRALQAQRQRGGDDGRRRQRRPGAEGGRHRRGDGRGRHRGDQGAGPHDPGRRQLRHHRAAVREGRGVLDNIRKFLRYLLSSNMGEVLTVFLGVVGAGVIGLTTATGIGALVLPLLATQILWINLITDTGPALAMGVDPIADDVMARKPRQP